MIRGQLARRTKQTTREFLLIDPTDFPGEGKRGAKERERKKEVRKVCLLVKAMFARNEIVSDFPRTSLLFIFK